MQILIKFRTTCTMWQFLLLCLLLALGDSQGSVKVTVFPSSTVPVNSSVEISCIHNYEQITDLDSSSLRFQVAGQICYSGCSGKKCSYDVKCLSENDPDRKLQHFRYRFTGYGGIFDKVNFRCSWGGNSDSITVSFKEPPKITGISSTNNEVVQTGRIILHCELDVGNEAVSFVSWILNDVQVAAFNASTNQSVVTNERISLQLSAIGNSKLQSELRIDDAQRFDAGSYSCSVSTAYGTARSSAALITVLSPLSSASLLGDYAHLQEGATVTLTCELHDGVAPFSLSIYEAEASDDPRQSPPSRIHTLLQTETYERASSVNVTLSRAHNLRLFTCTASDRLSVSSSSNVFSAPYRVTVYFPPNASALALQVEPAVSSNSSLLVENETYSLRCSLDAASLPAVELRWLRNGQLFNGASEQSHVTSDQFRGLVATTSLVLVANRNDNSAVWTCQASYLGHFVNQTQLSTEVFFPPSDVRAVLLHNMHLRPTISVTLQCVAVDSNPAAEISFQLRNDANEVKVDFDDQVESSTEQWTNEYNGTTVRRNFTLTNLTENEDKSQLICIFDQQVTKVVQRNVTISICGSPQVQLLIAASSATDGQLKEGDSVTLQCVVVQPACSELTTYLWFFNDNALLTQSASLHFSTLHSSQIGTYRCEAVWSNLNETASANYSLYFLYAPRCEVCDRYRSLVVTEKTTTFLHLRILSKPLPTRITLYAVTNQNETQPLSMQVRASYTKQRGTLRGEEIYWALAVLRDEEILVTIRIENIAPVVDGVYALLAEHVLTNITWTFELRTRTGTTQADNGGENLLIIVAASITACLSIVIIMVVCFLVRRRHKRVPKPQDDSVGNDAAYDALIDRYACTSFADGVSAAVHPSERILVHTPVIYQRVLSSASIKRKFDSKVESNLPHHQTHRFTDDVVAFSRLERDSICVFPPFKDVLRLFRTREVPDEFFGRPQVNEADEGSVFAWNELQNAVVDAPKYLALAKQRGAYKNKDIQYADIQVPYSRNRNRLRTDESRTEYTTIDFTKTAAHSNSNSN